MAWRMQRFDLDAVANCEGRAMLRRRRHFIAVLATDDGDTVGLKLGSMFSKLILMASQSYSRS